MAAPAVLQYYKKWVEINMGLEVKIITQDGILWEKIPTLKFVFVKFPNVSIDFVSDGLTIDPEITKFLTEFQGSHPDLKAAQTLKSGIQGFLLK